MVMVMVTTGRHKMAVHPAEAVASMTKRAFPWLVVPAALAAMPTITHLVNRLTGYDPTKAEKPGQPARVPPPKPALQGLDPGARKQLYARIVAQHILDPQQPALLQTAKGLHGYRAGL